MAKRPLPEHQYYLRDIFGRDGLFAKAFPGYERRDGQLRLTVAIHNAFREGYNLLAEGPCGTGKSMAYLVPAIEHARPGEAVVVATANIALQEQLFYKDLPALAKVLGKEIKYGLVKGKNNYLCQTRFGEWKEEQVGLYGSNDEETEAIIEWGSNTVTGDITELGRLLDAEPDWRTWSRICGDGDECKSCKDSECFAYQARAKAADSQVLICNYHVLFAHLELQAATGGQAGLLPPLKYVICVTGDMEVEFEDGRILPIKQVVHQRIPGKVKTVDPATGEVVFRRILRWNKNPRGDRRLVEVRHELGVLRCTEDHLVYTDSDGYVEARKLNKSSVLRCSHGAEGSSLWIADQPAYDSVGEGVVGGHAARGRNDHPYSHEDIGSRNSTSLRSAARSRVLEVLPLEAPGYCTSEGEAEPRLLAGRNGVRVQDALNQRTDSHQRDVSEGDLREQSAEEAADRGGVGTIGRPHRPGGLVYGRRLALPEREHTTAPHERVLHRLSEVACGVVERGVGCAGVHEDRQRQTSGSVHRSSGVRALSQPGEDACGVRAFDGEEDDRTSGGTLLPDLRRGVSTHTAADCEGQEGAALRLRGVCRNVESDLHEEPGGQEGEFVYDLTVDGTHCYFANGVLVHNCDEAHEMPDIARDFAQVSVSERGIRGLCTEALGREDPELRDRLERATDDFFSEVREYAESGDYKFLLKEPRFADARPLIEALTEHNALWEDLLDKVQGGDAKAKGYKKTLRRRMRRANTAIDHLMSITSLDNENYVYWIEGHQDEWERKRGRGEERPIKIHGKPKSVADYLEATLFSRTTSTIITSATLTTDGRFKWVKKELGIRAKVLAVDSPFDFDEQSLLVVPKMKTRPNDKGFIEEVTDELIDLLRDTDGRALGLFTSFKNMRAVADGLRCEDLPFNIIMQGEKPKAALLEEFLEDTHSVLLGTKSFWQGVDIKGEALTLLFIDKIPFPPPSDPVIAAMDEDPNENAFWGHSVPRATIALRQGFGRLIRSRDDVGVCVCFDNRLLKSRYGDAILNSLPAGRVETKVERVFRFLEKHGLVRDEEELEPEREFAGTPLDIPDDEVPF